MHCEHSVEEKLLTNCGFATVCWEAQKQGIFCASLTIYVLSYYNRTSCIIAALFYTHLLTSMSTMNCSFVKASFTLSFKKEPIVLYQMLCTLQQHFCLQNCLICIFVVVSEWVLEQKDTNYSYSILVKDMSSEYQMIDAILLHLSPHSFSVKRMTNTLFSVPIIWHK